MIGFEWKLGWIDQYSVLAKRRLGFLVEYAHSESDSEVLDLLSVSVQAANTLMFTRNLPLWERTARYVEVMGMRQGSL